LCNLEKTLLGATCFAISLITGVTANCLLKFPNFRCHGNKGWCFVNFDEAIKLHDLENPLHCATCFAISHINGVIANFWLKFPNFRYRGNKGGLKKITITTPYLEAMFQIWWRLVHKWRHSLVSRRWRPESRYRISEVPDTQVILYSVQCCYAVHWTDNYRTVNCLFLCHRLF